MRSEAGSGAGAGTPEIGPGAGAGTPEAALSLAQRRSWLLQRLNPEDRSLNVVLVFAIEGPLREDLLRRALETLVGRHESLRTIFGGGGDEPVVCITSEAACPCPTRDLSGLGSSELPVALARVEGEEFGRPFDLEKGPPVRACLVRLGSRRHRLIVVWHETAADTWSRRVVARELPLIYETVASTAEVPVSGWTRPSHWEAVARRRQWLLSPAAEEQLSYWRDQLEALPAETDLPTDRPRTPLQGVRGGIVEATLSSELGGKVTDLAGATGAPPEVVILAAFLAVLHRYTGAEDLAVGTVVSGRRPEEADLIGPFENTLVLRSRSTGRTTFADLVGATDRAVREAREHADLPFGRLVDVLKPARDLSRTPFFQIMFAACDGPASPGVGRTRWLPLLVHPGTAKHDLTLTLRRAQGPKPQPADGWTIELEYGLDIFDRETAARMVEHFQTLLADATLHPQRPLADLRLLTADEIRKLLVEWNDTATDFPRDLCVHELYGAQAARTPEAVAVEFEDESLTYRELDQRGNRLANRLRRLGVGPETLVGLAVERSLEMVVGLLGILKAGGAYVPLDPAYPGPRLGFMIEDIGAPVVLTQARFADALPAGSARLVSLDTDWPDIATESDVAPAGGVGPENLIYVMYTSGSTGRPKGVAVTHQGVVRLVKETGYARFGPDETFLQLSNMAFDVATFEIWGCLLNGGRLVVFPAHAPTLSELGQVLRERGVTTLWLTAGLFHLMVDENLAGLRGVRQLLAGGDVLSAPHVRRVLAERGDGTLIDGYGPTEATTFASCHPMTKDSIVGASVSIGRPIANTTLYVLDGYGNPTPIGVPGELYIGGVGLARGYWKRPDLTAEMFIPDAFGSGPGARLYRTGDLARFLSDGNIEFLGRLDNQVKVRGFRVELGEIEAVLGQHPALQTVAVVARDGGGGIAGQKRLSAYVVPIAGQGVSPAELRDYLRDRLPDYMLPADFVVLDRLPLSPSGKVDRRNLPRPSLAGPEAAGRGHGWTPFEDVMGAIWTQVLGRAPAATDSFFEAGGNSLLATRLVSRVHSLLGVELPLQAVFETPTLAGLAGVIEDARRAGPGGGLPPLVAVDRGQDLPLSFAQRRLWFWDRYEPGSPLYNLPFVFRLEGLLDPKVLGRALSEIVDRHEVLRTTFRDTADGPAQVIAPGRGGMGEGLPLPAVDLSSLPPDARMARLDALILEEALRTFDLGRGPLVRATLVGLGPEGHILLLSLHHIVFDGWSLGVLTDELAALYEAFSSGRPSPLPELRLQYADFAVWQRKWLSDEVLEQGLAYWRRQLADLLVPDLPTDRPRPRVQSFRGRTLRFTLPRDLTQELRDLGSRHGATLFMTLLAGFQTLLHRLSGQDDIAVGSPIANRTLGGVEGLIGFFVNTLVLRTDFSGQPTFAELIGRVREITVGAYAHQDLPFEQLVEEVRPARDPSRSPLFQVMFALQNAPAGTVEPPGLKVSVRETPTGTAKFDLTLQLWETGSGLDGELEYATDLYEEATARRLVGHFETLLRGAVADPGRRLGDLPLLTPEERRRVLVEWNATETAYPREATVHQLFAERARATPEVVAVESGSGSLTYRELDWRSDRLAAYLRRLGVGSETLVGVAVERSPEMVVGLLGVLKSGGAYVPLDSTYPRERLAFMVADTQAPVVLTLDHLAASLPETGATIIRLDSDWPLIAGANPEEPAAGPAEAASPVETAGPAEAGRPAVSPDGLAYVIYTSGSTGRPKGVAVTHRNIVRLVKETNYARFGPEEVFLHLAPLAFDASTFEIWGPLLGGGRLVVFPPERPSLEELGRALTRHKVTTLFLTTALFNLLVDERLEDLGKVSQLLAGGEVMSVTHVRRAADGRPGCVMSAVYGPTEATTFASHCPMGGRGEATSVPIGRPIANTTLYVLDRNLTPVPEGVAGEIYVGGDGVARGYHNQPVPTAEKFVPDPFAARPGARLYRTGDLGRYLPGGDVDFLGRVDNQVKIRGFRIEPEEVETVLGQYPAVREAVVLVREDPLGERRLVAYVASVGAPPTFITELRSFLRERLPDYMVPPAIVVLERFPLGPSGKVDRGGLPAPELGEPVEVGSFLAPTGPVEEGLARIWGELLGLERISAAADFFALGGHSLLATRAVSRVREAFGVELPLRTLFEAPTLSGLAARIAAALPASVAPASLASGPPIVARERRGPSPLSYAQQRLWFLDQLAPGGPLYNVPVAMRLEGRLDAKVLERSLAEIVRRHETLRTTFAEEDGSPVQIISPDAGFTLTSVDLSDQPRISRERALAELASDEARRPFTLDEGPLLRVTLVEFDREEQALLLTVHHIAADGWALEILFGELVVLYEAFGAGRPSPLTGLRVQYADFALWQREWVQAGALRDQLAYWRGQLGPPLPTLDLPFAHPRPAAVAYRGLMVSRLLGREVVDDLRALGRREGLTLFMILLAAFVTLLYRVTGQKDIVVGTSVANRTQLEVEGLIGCFVNTLPLRTDLSGNPTFGELLDRVREVTLAAFTHQDVPFDLLVDTLQLPRDPSRPPLVAVLFDLHETPLCPPVLGRARVTPLEVDAGVSKFDFNIEATAGPGGLDLALYYRRDLYEPRAMEGFLDQYHHLLAAVAADAGRRLEALPLGTEQDQLSPDTLDELFAEERGT